MYELIRLLPLSVITFVCVILFVVLVLFRDEPSDKKIRRVDYKSGESDNE